MIPLAVFVGGGLGALARWGTGVALTRALPAAVIPWATLVVNVSGCFALGVLLPVFTARSHWPLAIKAGVATGVLGGLTTFSTFGVETVRAWHSAPGLGLLNLALNLGVGLVAAAVGLWIGGRLA